MNINTQSTYRIPLELSFSSEESPVGLLSTSVPLPVGALYDLQHCHLLHDGKNVSCGARILATWPDKSIKWVHLSFSAPQSNQSKFIFVTCQQDDITPKSVTQALSYTQSDSQTKVHHSDFSFVLDHNNGHFSLAPKKNNIAESNPLSAELILKDAFKHDCTMSSCNVAIHETPDLLDGAVFALQLIVEMTYSDAEQGIYSAISAINTFSFSAEQSAIKLDVTLHNPACALHSGGSWDLGDANSFHFSELSVNFHSDVICPVNYRVESQQEWKIAETLPIAITQHSSGGTNWQSPVHVDHEQKIPFAIKGYCVQHQDAQAENGLRATPSIHWANFFNVTLEHFWQKFPSAVLITEDRVSLGLFPAQADIKYELQGGEKSTHTLWLAANEDKNALNGVHTAPSAKADTIQYANSDMPLYIEHSQRDAKLQQLINNGLLSHSNFFEKREQLDEYGWRNFGDLYADHETAEHDASSIFVSHYNNQYDPIYGFLRQYLISGDHRWFTLADDLAKHVKDIDIYHTKDDKSEYNGGLFWHTDHYLQAFTSSHRSYSKHQGKGAYQDHAGGGGPGGQHCYTSGLALYHLLTGDEAAKQAVLTLTDWITYVYEGGNTCLELLLALKNRHVLGLKNHFSGQYPLDRGTANYINALLDSYVLVSDTTLLEKVEHIIYHTAHPDEDVSLRKLENVEETWFYIVFLQAVVRYLDIKRKTNDYDRAFYYARDCLLNYAHWILEHDYMYLDKPDILEYPNDTWTAQDLRKAHVLAAAYFYSNKSSEEYQSKALYFENQVASRIAASDTKTYTRIMVLLMQNDGPTAYFTQTELVHEFKSRETNWPAPDYVRKGSFSALLLKAFSKRLLEVSISNEVNWLKKRLG